MVRPQGLYLVLAVMHICVAGYKGKYIYLPVHIVILWDPPTNRLDTNFHPLLYYRPRKILLRTNVEPTSLESENPMK